MSDAHHSVSCHVVRVRTQGEVKQSPSFTPSLQVGREGELQRCTTSRRIQGLPNTTAYALQSVLRSSCTPPNRPLVSGFLGFQNSLAGNTHTTRRDVPGTTFGQSVECGTKARTAGCCRSRTMCFNTPESPGRLQTGVQLLRPFVPVAKACCLAWGSGRAEPLADGGNDGMIPSIGDLAGWCLVQSGGSRGGHSVPEPRLATGRLNGNGISVKSRAKPRITACQ